ncbi:hypothetical protein IFR41_25115 [Pseudomonas fluorescens]|uniref:hypothetical protein n=1 Tax=Pseudomonas veronii TaxID=76761 RepID=UPI000A7DDF5A|nr:hypothetical protein [Pseudomonas veronii]MBD8742812.1 hypothetical protein [Pseudomonas fluorescens]
MKRNLILATCLLGMGQVQAACNDRYYYYRPSLTETTVKKWQIYEDKEFIKSKELDDIKRMISACGPPITDRKYNIFALVNIIVPANFYKLRKPLYNQPNIHLPNGVDGGKGAYIDVPKSSAPTSEQAQYTSEISAGGRVGLVLVYLVRDGVDELRTPTWYYKKNQYLHSNGYSFTEYK